MFYAACPENTTECLFGRVDGLEPPCISPEQRCDGIADCIGGEDEKDHNCPCAPEAAVRLVDGTVPHQGRVEFCTGGRWSTLTDTTRATTVLCRQLGYPNAGENTTLRIIYISNVGYM